MIISTLALFAQSNIQLEVERHIQSFENYKRIDFIAADSSINNILLIASSNDIDTLKFYGFKLKGALRQIFRRDSVMYYYRKSLKNFADVSHAEQGKLLNNMSGYFSNISRFDSALYYALEARKKILETRDSLAIFTNINQLARIYTEINEYENATEYYDLSVGFRGSVPDIHFAGMLVNKTLLFKRLGDFGRMLAPLHQAKRIAEELQHSTFISNVYYNMSEYYMIDEYTNLDSAEYYALACKQLAEESAFHQGVIRASIIEAKVLLRKGRYTDAIEKLNIIDTNATSPQIRSSISFEKSEIFRLQRNFKLALEEFKNYHESELESFETEKAKALAEFESLYENERQKNEILKLTLDNSEKESSLYKLQVNTMVAIVLSLIAMVFAVGLWVYQRNKRQLESQIYQASLKEQAHKHETQLLKEQVNSSDREKNRIGAELHDGVASQIVSIVYDVEGLPVDTSQKLTELYNDVRRLSHDLNYTHKEGATLYDMLDELIPEGKLNNTFHLKVNPEGLSLNELQGQQFFRITQELLANNLKYAVADTTILRIDRRDMSLSYLYEDDGRGTSKLRERQGLSNIRKRVSLLNGNVSFSSSEGEGFTCSIEIPL